MLHYSERCWTCLARRLYFPCALAAVGQLLGRYQTAKLSVVVVQLQLLADLGLHQGAVVGGLHNKSVVGGLLLG